MARPVRGILVVEGVQTGDGRLIIDGATTWVDPPLPIGWLEREQHGDLLEGAVQVGTIDTITRSGNEVRWTGTLDDGQPDGAEMVRRMTEAVAPLGVRWGLSIDPDDWEMELVLTERNEDGEDDGVIIVASGSPFPVTAAAGDPDVEDGEVLFEDAADAMLQRFTRLRIRGATAVAIGAFAEAYMELADEATEDAETEPEPAPVAASGCADCEGTPLVEAVPVAFSLVRSDPLAEWFGMDAEPEEVVPVGIDAETGRIFGFTALWGTCHIGNPEVCVTPPMSPSGYRYFHTGVTRFNLDRQAHTVPCGRITMGIGHAPLDLGHAAAAAHYDNTRWNRASVCNHENSRGIWYSGALSLSTTEAECEALLACGGISGDWRPIGGALEHVAALAVNVPGFPVPRSLVASAPPDEARAQVRLIDGQVTAMVGAGLSAVVRESGRRSSRRERAGSIVQMRPDPETLRRLSSVERQLAALAPQTAAALVGRIRRGA